VHFEICKLWSTGWEEAEAKRLVVWKVIKGKGKVVPVFLTEHHAIKAYWGTGGTDLLIL
jgi:hypothetical protein